MGRPFVRVAGEAGLPGGGWRDGASCYDLPRRHKSRPDPPHGPEIHLADPARGPTVEVGNNPSCSPTGRESTMKLYGGIDLHSNNSVLALLAEDERLVYRKRLPNDAVVWS